MTLIATVLAVLLAGASVAAEPAPVGPQLEAARALVAVMLPPAEREKTFETILNSFMGNQLAGMMQANPAIQRAMQDDPDVRPIFAAFVERQRKLALSDLRESERDLIDAYATAYARNFTLAELKDLRSFFTSPTGTKYASRSATLVTDPAIGAWQRAIAAKVEQRKPEEVERLLEELGPAIDNAKRERQDES